MPVFKVRKNNTWEKVGIGSITSNNNADTVDGKHASDFGSYVDVENLKTLVGANSVQNQINTAINSLKEEILGGRW